MRRGLAFDAYDVTDDVDVCDDGMLLRRRRAANLTTAPGYPWNGLVTPHPT